MSWNVTFVGTPEAICKALDKQESQMSGQSLVEFQAAKPSMQTLLRENFNNAPDAQPICVKLTASGHGQAKQVSRPDKPTTIEQVDRCCRVNIEYIGNLVS